MSIKLLEHIQAEPNRVNPRMIPAISTTSNMIRERSSVNAVACATSSIFMQCISSVN